LATPKAKRILIAPLDWGLGHTSRCIPIIRHVLRLGHVPIVAGNQWQRSFIEKTFSDIEFIHLDGYNVTYSRINLFAQAGVLSQLPRLQKVIKAEQEWIQTQVRLLNLDGIISDNRYGLYHDTAPSVILTHQLQVKTGMGSIADSVIRKLHYKLLDRFSDTWVVDIKSNNGLAGKLSHPAAMPARAQYIGLLSQFENSSTGSGDDGSLVILLSGPEPQRTELSALLWQQIQAYTGKVIFTEGSTSAARPAFIPPHISYHQRLTGKDLLPILQDAPMIICRSGYSTIMDLAILQKNAILIPTPGQTEQKYLARYLRKKGIFYSVPQLWFDLQKALRDAALFPFRAPEVSACFNGYQRVLADWITNLSA